MTLDAKGNLGIGVTNPSAKIELLTPATSFEAFLKLKTSDSANDYFTINNATGANGQLIPNLVGQHTSDNRQALYLSGRIGENNDVGTEPIMIFDSRITNRPVNNRPLFGWDSYGKRRMTLDAKGNLGIGVTNPDKKLTIKSNEYIGWEYTDNGSGSYHTITGGGVNPMSFTVSPFSANDPIFKFNGHNGTKVTILNGGNLGIGIPNPSTKLDVNGIISSRNEIRSISSNPALLLNESDVTDKNWHLQVNGGDLKFYEVNDARNNWNKRMIIKSGSGNVAIHGKLESKEIKVTNTPTADFVFEKDYNLPTLKSIEKYIKEKKHLPEIASAKEMEKNGVNVGNFQIQLLQKIEELTLYTIDQEKKLKTQRENFEQQQEEINSQKEEIEELKKQNSEIKELKALVQKLLKDKN